MPRKLREVERLHVSAGALEPLVALMDRLSGAGDGWVNLVPVDPDRDEQDEQPTTLPFMTLFSGGGTKSTMITWLPGRPDRHGTAPQSLGISHPARRRAAGVLAADEAGVPPTWTIEQDHPHRGLVVRPPADEAAEVVVRWALRAAGVLSTRAFDLWRADVHLPPR